MESAFPVIDSAESHVFTKLIRSTPIYVNELVVYTLSRQ